MLGLGIALAIFGLIMIGLGFWAKKGASVVPLYIGCGLSVLNIVATLSEGKISGIIISGLMAHALYKGAQAGPLPKSGARVFTENGPLDGDF